MEDREFFSGDNVYVSLTRFVAFGKTYAMSAVTSVRADVIKPSRFGPIFIAFWGLLFLLVGFDGHGGFMTAGVVTLVLAASAANAQRPQYYVCLSTSSGEVQAVKSENREFIASIVQALNDCIVARG